jgi:hypothetical protein
MTVDSLCHCLQIKFTAVSVQSAYRFSVRILRYRKFIDPGFETEVQYIIIITVFWAQQPPQWARASSFLRFLEHTQRRTTVSKTPLDEWSARHIDLCLTTHNTHNRHPCPVGIRTHNLSRRAAADQRLRPRCRWPTKLVLFINVLTDLIKIINPGLGIKSIASLQ